MKKIIRKINRNSHKKLKKQSWNPGLMTKEGEFLGIRLNATTELFDIFFESIN